jgi:hypothetical protein
MKRSALPATRKLRQFSVDKVPFTGQKRVRGSAAGLWACQQPRSQSSQHANPSEIDNRYGTISPSRRSGLRFPGAIILYSPMRAN